MNGESLPDGGSKAMLLAFITDVKAEEDEIRAHRERQAEICKEAKSAGFETSKIREVVRWLCKVDRHGREKVDEAEAIFDLYRSVADGGGRSLDMIMNDDRDRALLNRFVPDDQDEARLSRRRRSMKKATAMAAAAKFARE
ncbi:MAG: DUF2312 domain-containing protein [Sphingobium sp.]|nr:DUF2312 domain-containing protein [Sphingobium sp.]